MSECFTVKPQKVNLIRERVKKHGSRDKGSDVFGLGNSKPPLSRITQQFNFRTHWFAVFTRLSISKYNRQRYLFILKNTRLAK